MVHVGESANPMDPIGSQWSFLVPLIGGRYHMIPQVAVYTTYILPIGWLYITDPTY